MNVHTIEISKDEALTKLAEYRRLNRRQIQPEDARLRNLYQKVSKGARVVNVFEAFKATGLNELGQPKLAIARADWQTVHFHPRCWIQDLGTSYNSSRWVNGAGAFEGSGTFKEHAYASTVAVPRDTFDNGKLIQRGSIKSPVPHIPPSIRPAIALSNFHILFEVEKWEEYPVDPFLLRHIAGGLYVVMAEWELTPLEASLLSSMRSGN